MTRRTLLIAVTASALIVSVSVAGRAAEKSSDKATLDLYRRPAQVPYPADNAYSKAREELGKKLFFDPRLSGSNAISCATCHNPSFSWTDSLAKGVGHGHKQLGRRSPTLLNLAWTPRLFWDGRAASLEEQALGPIQAEGEMNMKIADLPGKIQAISEYRPLFERAYPGEPISNPVIAKAIATYERGIVSGKAPFDRFIAGDRKAISEQAKHGFALFNTTAKCASCHSGWSFTDGSFHDIGVAGDDIGRGKFLPRLASQQHAFKTPTLRNCARHAPYMHDGSAPSLAEVVEFYDRGGDAKRESLAAEIKPLGLSKTDKEDLVTFLGTLTSADAPVTVPELPR